MTALPEGLLSISDGAIVLSAELVAPRLGLTPDALQAELRRGQITCLVEAGVDEDRGRTRVTVRHHTRSWTVVIEADGTERAATWTTSAFPLQARAVPPDRIGEQLRACLQNMAAACLTITYGGLARLLDLSPPNTIRQVTVALEHLMEEDAADGSPFIAALVVGKARGDLPAVGFFECARRLGRFGGDPEGVEARKFHATELDAALKYWGRSDASCCKQYARSGDAMQRACHE